MLDFMRETNKGITAEVLAHLFQGRPYTKVVPFAVTFSGVVGEFTPIWLPQNAYFEVAFIRVKSSTVAAEVTFSDTDPSAALAFAIAVPTGYENVFLGLATYRSLQSSNPKLLLVDFQGVANTIKGTVYGWEVTREGFYR